MAIIFKEKRIAVIGVSHREEKFGFKIFRDLLRAGYYVQGINLRKGNILGKKIYQTLSDLEEKPDVVITVVPAKVTEQIVEECKQLGIKELWMQPGSDSKEAIEKAQKYGLEVTAHQCFMMHEGIW